MASTVDGWAIVLVIVIIIVFALVVALSVWAVFCRKPDAEDRTPSPDTVWYWSPLGKTHSVSLVDLGGGRARQSDAALAAQLQRAVSDRHRVDGTSYKLCYFDRTLQNFLEVDTAAFVHSPEAVTNTAYAPLSLVQLHRSGSGGDGLLGSKSSLAARPHHYEGGIVRKGGSVVPPAPRIYPAEPNIDTTTPVVIVAYRYVYVHGDEAETAQSVGGHTDRPPAATAVAVDTSPKPTANSGTTSSLKEEEAVVNPRLVGALDHLMNRGLLQHQETETIVDPVTHERRTYRLTLLTPTEITLQPDNGPARTLRALGFPIRVSHANDSTWPAYHTPFTLPLGRWCVKAEAHVPLLDPHGHSRGDVAIGPSTARTFTVMHGVPPAS